MRSWKLFGLTLIYLNILSCPYDEGGFTKENDLWIDTNEAAFSFFLADDVDDSVDKEDFHQVIDEIAAVFKPIVAQQGGKLVMHKNWEDGTVNAYAHRTEENKLWHVSMFGGLARHPEVTKDGFAMVVCHELGHHIAGYPYKEWASNEGQSDYFAAMKCFKAIYGDEDNTYIFDKVYSSKIDDECRTVYPEDENEAATCVRTALAGQSLANLLADLREIKAPSIEAESDQIASEHFHDHPEPQCRLDTYFQGALCDKSKKLYGENSYDSNYCSRAEGLILGVRPKCWFNEDQAKEDQMSSTSFAQI